MGEAISLNLDCFSILTRLLEIHLFIYIRIYFFPGFLIYESYVRHEVSMDVEVLLHYVHRCRSQDLSSSSHIPKRKISPSISTSYNGCWTENHVFNVMNTALATPNCPGCCCKRRARISMQKYVRHVA